MRYKLFWAIRALCYKLCFGRVGWLSYIGPPVFLYGVKSIFIGSKVRIFPNSRLEVHGDKASIIIEDDVAIGQNVHITSGDKLIIGKSSTILANVFITNIDHNYEQLNTHILKQDWTIQPTRIGENCFIGIGAAIQAGTILGKQCIIGANSVVRGEFPDYCVIVGAPAKIVKKFNFETQRWEKIQK